MATREQDFAARTDRRSVRVSEGVYIVRYATTASHNEPPSATFSGNAPDATLSFMLAPGLSDPVLREPGQYLLVRAEKPAQVEILVRAQRPGGSIDAQFELEKIAPAIQVKAPAPKGDIEILAHVARRGDLTVRPGDWICGPDLPMVIEGLEVHWPAKPTGVALSYTAIVGREQRALPECAEGQFAGTRGRATPLVGFKLSLRGPAAERYELHVDSLFLGAQVKATRGRDVTISGPTGREPLVGLRLSIEAVQTPAQKIRTPAAPPRARRNNKKVQVFRSGSHSTASL